MERVSFAEMTHWIAFYTLEADQQLPSEQRPVRARNPNQAVAALDRAFRINRN